MGCVFMITCVPTGEFYIGGTKQKYKDIKIGRAHV